MVEQTCGFIARGFSAVDEATRHAVVFVNQPQRIHFRLAMAFADSKAEFLPTAFCGNEWNQMSGL
jgi:hypothetical protein